MAAKKTKGVAMRVSQSALAREIIDHIKSVRTELGGSVALKPGQRKKIGVNATVSNEFIEAAAVAVDGMSALRVASGFDTAAAREVIAFSAAFQGVAEEADALATLVRDTILSRRAGIGADALHTYNLAKGLARKADGADLLPHIAEMKKALGRGGPGKKKKAAKAGP